MSAGAQKKRGEKYYQERRIGYGRQRYEREYSSSFHVLSRTFVCLRAEKKTAEGYRTEKARLEFPLPSRGGLPPYPPRSVSVVFSFSRSSLRGDRLVVSFCLERVRLRASLPTYLPSGAHPQGVAPSGKAGAQNQRRYQPSPAPPARRKKPNIFDKRKCFFSLAGGRAPAGAFRSPLTRSPKSPFSVSIRASSLLTVNDQQARSPINRGSLGREPLQGIFSFPNNKQDYLVGGGCAQLRGACRRAPRAPSAPPFIMCLLPPCSVAVGCALLRGACRRAPRAPSAPPFIMSLLAVGFSSFLCLGSVGACPSLGCCARLGRWLLGAGF